ncbi:C40 family peptidase [Intrasporangium chromatireducens]|uniref:C40 family peptidase n=1 Tax=Intrasporangium chromatireducens TaxID=1386088 RepID=UPI0004BBBE86|nr:C40 family peptidase [Intrasporangium chromatireducens]
MSHTPSVRGAALRPPILHTLLALGLILTLGLAAPPESGGATATTSAQAAPATPVTIAAAPAAVTYSLRMQAVRIAASKKGDPYRWGAAGPYAFDCSGLVYYIYRTRLHRSMPRGANDQRLASIPISKSQKRPGDLIFFMSGGRAYHVGIYAGYGRIWHAPRPGQVVQLSRIWTSYYVVRRAR